MGRETIRLVTRGRKTGQPREATLYAFPDGDDLIVVGSRGGAAHDPGWAENLRTHPEASVRRGGATGHVLAEEADGEERERLWEVVASAFPMYRSFQKRTARRIPVFVLRPTSIGAGGEPPAS